MTTSAIRYIKKIATVQKEDIKILFFYFIVTLLVHSKENKMHADECG